MDEKHKMHTEPPGSVSTTPSRAKSHRSWALLIIFMLVILAILAIGIHKGRKQLASAPEWHPLPVPVATAPVERLTLRQTLSYLARLEPLATAEIAAKLSARIEAIYCDEGDVVEPGKLLAKLDDRDFRAQVEAIKAKILSQRARVKGNQAELESTRQNVSFLQREYERDDHLFQQKGISASALGASKNRLDSAIGKMRSLEEEARSIEQELKALSAQLEEARTWLSYTEIRSPNQGVVRRHYVEVGDMAKPGAPLFSLMDRSTLRLVFDIVQEDLSRVRPGQKVLIHWPVAVAEEEREVELARIFPALEAGKTVRAEVDLSFPCPASLKMGSFVAVEVVVREESGLTVPRGAIVPLPGGSRAVYAVRDGKLELIPVHLSFSDEQRSLVQADLQEDDSVAVGEYLQWVRHYQGQPVEVPR